MTYSKLILDASNTKLRSPRKHKVWTISAKWKRHLFWSIKLKDSWNVQLLPALYPLPLKNVLLKIKLHYHLTKLYDIWNIDISYDQEAERFSSKGLIFINMKIRKLKKHRIPKAVVTFPAPTSIRILSHFWWWNYGSDKWRWIL